MWCDESWRTDTKEFRRGILPFLSTGGDLLASGITTADTSNLMYNIHFEISSSTPMISDCFLTYNFLMQDYPRRANNLREQAEEEFNTSGFDSTESQTNYRLTWDVLEENQFYSLDMLKKNNNFSKSIALEMYDEHEREYCVGGLDLATLNDYCVLTIWDVYKTSRLFINEHGQKDYKIVWKNQLRDVITYNLDKKPLSAEEVAKKAAKDCNTNKIDMIMIDGTASQRTHNEWIYKEIKSLGISTLVCPYDFSGDKNKVILMNNFEQMLRSGLVVYAAEQEIKESETFKLLYKETIKLFKGYEKGKKNMQWKAKGKGNTDDHVMSAALGSYCVPFIEYLEKRGKFIEINSYRYRAKLTKFKNKQQPSQPNYSSTWLKIR